jgi:hypothetical protein
MSTLSKEDSTNDEQEETEGTEGNFFSVVSVPSCSRCPRENEKLGNLSVNSIHAELLPVNP